VYLLGASPRIVHTSSRTPNTPWVDAHRVSEPSGAGTASAPSDSIGAGAARW
jgi:hypothetical protein